MSTAKPNQDTRNNKVEGEGSYTAAKEYDDATREFVKSGKVEQAAHDAAPKTSQEADEMRAAEDEGRSHAKGSQQTTRIANPNTGTDTVSDKGGSGQAAPEKTPGRKP